MVCNGERNNEIVDERKSESFENSKVVGSFSNNIEDSSVSLNNNGVIIFEDEEGVL